MHTTAKMRAPLARRAIALAAALIHAAWLAPALLAAIVFCVPAALAEGRSDRLPRPARRRRRRRAWVAIDRTAAP